MKISRIKYYPTLSVKENAKKNNCSEASIRLYIKENSIDRRGMEKARKIEICRKYFKHHKNTSRHKMSVETNISMSWITQYWEYITTDKDFTFFDSKKSKKNKKVFEDNYYKPHPSVYRDILVQEQFSKSIIFPFLENEKYSLIATNLGYTVYTSLEDAPKRECDIIAIPSVTENLRKLVEACLLVCKKKIALLLPISFLSGEERYKSVYNRLPLKQVLIYNENLNIEREIVDDENILYNSKLSEDNYAWFLFEKGYKDKTPMLSWISHDREVPIRERDISETKVLDGVVFYPNEQFSYPIEDVIEFHSRALPENKVLSNHYNCILKFRGIEFYGVEQLFMGLTYSYSPKILKEIFEASSCPQAKTVGKRAKDFRRDWDFYEKQYQVIFVCHLYKYLCFKPFRERLRELRNEILVECPFGADNHFACIQNLDTNKLEGNNCSGRSMMYIRDMMLKLEDEAINKKEKEIGGKLSKIEKEKVIECVCDKVRAEFDKNPSIIALSKRLFDYIKKNNIPTNRKKRPSELGPEINIDFKSKCLIVNFDYTLFDTSIDDKLRKSVGVKNWKKIHSLIHKYELYDGWREVFDYLKKNNIKLGILSNASADLIKRTLECFEIQCDAIVGFNLYFCKPSPIVSNELLEKLNVRHKQILYVGSTITDEIQARCANLRFVAALWDSKEEQAFREKGCEFISNPREIITILKNDYF